MPQQQSNTPDERLLRLAANGNKKAFGWIYERYLGEIYRFVFYRVGDPLEAEDITENAFIKAWEHLPDIYAKGDEISNFRAWIYRIAKNLAIDFLRGKAHFRLDDVQLIATDKSPEELVQQKNLSRQMAEAIQTLEPAMQEVVILRFINNLSHSETAQIMGLNPGHTRVLQYRALKKLQAFLVTKELVNV